MRIRGSNEGSRKAGTSVRLNTFDLLEEEDEVMRQKNSGHNLEQIEAEKRERTLDLLKEEAERMKGIAWADINDDEDFDVSQNTGHLNSSTVEIDEKDEEDEQPAEIFLHMEPQKQKSFKNKDSKANKSENFEDLIADLTKLKEGKGGDNEEVQSDVKDAGVDVVVVDENERERAKAQLRARIQASATQRKKPGKEEEPKKKTKSERKDARRQFER